LERFLGTYLTPEATGVNPADVGTVKVPDVAVVIVVVVVSVKVSTTVRVVEKLEVRVAVSVVVS
jgi:hypothetical protein